MVALRYAPGSAHVVATRDAVVLIDAPISTELLTGIWREVDGGRGLAAVLEALSGAFGTSLTSIPPFVVAVAEPEGVRLAVRGDILVTAQGAAGTENITGTGVTTWSERLVAAATTAIRVGSAAAATPADLPLRDGVVRASALIVDWSEAGRAASPVGGSPALAVPFAGPTSAHDASPTGGAAPDRGSADAHTPPVLRTVREGDEPVVLQAPPALEPEPVTLTVPVPPAPASPADPAAPADPGASADPAATAEAPAGPWSRLSAAPAESPTPAPPLIDSSVVLTAGSVDTWLPQDATLAPDPAVDDEPAVSSTTGYDHLWGATVVRSVEEAAVRGGEDEVEQEDADASPGADVADTVGSVRRPGDHDGETISVAQARALRTAAGEPGDDLAGSGQDPLEQSVPPLAPPRPAAPGRLRLSTGQEVLLDRTVVIGRRPRSTRVTGTDLPHLVAVESPEQDISRSHLEVRVEGDSILVTDLHTTNGTTLHRPGTDPVRLHPGERTVVVAGDVLDLGDGIAVTVEDIA